jgi:gluconolactonase
VLRRNLSTGATVVLADRYDGKHFNGPNDVTSDAQGRIYFTDTRYRGDESLELPHAFYRIDPNGKLTRLATDLVRPNGIEVSPDGRRLYVFESNNNAPINPKGPATDKFGVVGGAVIAYDLDKAGNISNGRVFFRSDPGMAADGSAMDTEGNLYLAQHNGNPDAPKCDIVVLSPSGKVLGHLPVPGKGLTTNLAFGRGVDRHSLYVTTGAPWGLYRIQTVKVGHYF